MTEASLKQNLAAARNEHLVPGREIHMQDLRGHRFCEVGLITGTGQDDAVANIWNTTGASDPTPEQFDALRELPANSPQAARTSRPQKRLTLTVVNETLGAMAGR